MQVSFIYTEEDPWALGMRSVSAVLRRAGHETKLLFLQSQEQRYQDVYLKRIREIVKDSDIIGLSCMARGSEKARQVIDYLRSGGALLVWGGIHATLFPEDCVASADVICRGEGEGFMLELVERLESDRDWRDMANATYRNNGSMQQNPLRPLVEDLDGLPLPDFRHDNEYHFDDKGLRNIKEVFNVREPIMFNGSRGCPYPCTYCVNSKLQKLYAENGRYVRKMSMAQYVASVRELKEHFPAAKYVYLIDEDFFAFKAEELRQFAEEFPRQVGLPFECMGSPVRFNEEKLERLVAAGLWRVRIGLESGSERTKREVYRRNMSNEAVLRTAREIVKYPQVVLCYFFIIANPFEDRQDLRDTIRFIANLPYPFYSQVYNLVFFPGTLLHERAAQEGLIDGKTNSGFELNYRGGLKYESHPWKRQNLYLNGLLFLMEGKSSCFRLGLLPRFLITPLIRPSIISFNDRFPILSRGAIKFKLFTLFLRRIAARFLQKALRNPNSVYNLSGFIKQTLKNIIRK